ncbi:uncharacterized protein MONBRDRAFT_10000 [Monosiga brevicollis MX1]|uniref:Uncharacterized protein n=1 Tax=Monosiga brevicollis TaxID=81824 RepID=A9V4W6_MONBE|nr:uncharacterized protein MONBRDRAFT_10000 [Monosiga brevicollis MX1]EDQ87527.1 predicted protein [Monosiga brevicollis MX1]|eukprot:XP_001747787.1 hypothetical protein [Monosiga brevicollis MX1]
MAAAKNYQRVLTACALVGPPCAVGDPLPACPAFELYLKRLQQRQATNQDAPTGTIWDLQAPSDQSPAPLCKGPSDPQTQESSGAPLVEPSLPTPRFVRRECATSTLTKTTIAHPVLLHLERFHAGRRFTSQPLGSSLHTSPPAQKPEDNGLLSVYTDEEGRIFVWNNLDVTDLHLLHVQPWSLAAAMVLIQTIPWPLVHEQSALVFDGHEQADGETLDTALDADGVKQGIDQVDDDVLYWRAWCREQREVHRLLHERLNEAFDDLRPEVFLEENTLDGDRPTSRASVASSGGQQAFWGPPRGEAPQPAFSWMRQHVLWQRLACNEAESLATASRMGLDSQDGFALASVVGLAPSSTTVASAAEPLTDTVTSALLRSRQTGADSERGRSRSRAPSSSSARAQQAFQHIRAVIEESQAQLRSSSSPGGLSDASTPLANGTPSTEWVRRGRPTFSGRGPPGLSTAGGLMDIIMNRQYRTKHRSPSEPRLDRRDSSSSLREEPWDESDGAKSPRPRSAPAPKRIKPTATADTRILPRTRSASTLRTHTSVGLDASRGGSHDPDHPAWKDTKAALIRRLRVAFEHVPVEAYAGLRDTFYDVSVQLVPQLFSVYLLRKEVKARVVELNAMPSTGELDELIARKRAQLKVWL